MVRKTVATAVFTALAMGFVSGSVQAQLSEKATSKANENSVVKAVRSGRSNNLADLQRNYEASKPAAKRSGAINPLQIPARIKEQNRFNVNDSSATDQRLLNSFSPAFNAPAALISAEGYSSDDNAAVVGGRVTPPDTNGDVGLNHYVQYVNLGWVVLDKNTGNTVAGPFPGNLFWQGFGGVCDTQNAGDPIVLYDHLAGRWLFSQFTGTSDNDGHQCVAISDGEDPLGPYTLYDFVVSPNAFNDYPKISVWPDGYYMTTHEFAGAQLSFAGVNLTVFDRNAMLAGDTNAGFIQFSNVDSGEALEFGVQVGHLEGNDLPPAGSCNTLIHATDTAAFGLPGADRFRFWQACVDFNNPNNSSLNQVASVTAPSFDQNFCGFNRDCIDQNSASGTNLDGLAGFTLYRFNQRYFPAEGVMKGAVTTNVDVGGDRAGVLWAGFDVNPLTSAASISDNGATIGVVDFNDGLNRWMGSAAVDSVGNIGIGYTVAGNSGVFPSIRFTLHERGFDGPGQVQAESSCVEGTGSTEGANRWADYSSTSVDPVDQCTFWHTNEYVETTGNFQWNTRVCSFRAPSCGDGEPVNRPPSASFDANCNDLSCSFDASASSDSDGNIVSYAWSFGDGNNGSGVTTSNTYSAGGTFSVTLTVTDNEGATGSSTQQVTVVDPNALPIDLSTTVLNRGRVRIDWSGANGSRVDLFRNGALRSTTRNDGSFTDRPGSGTHTYQVCEQNSNVCSNLSTVTL
jgi:chitodextrinase